MIFWTDQNVTNILDFLFRMEHVDKMCSFALLA